MKDSVFYFFSGFRWQDILDILLNSYILFRLYILFRGTRVLRALVAMFVFWAAGQVAVSLGLIITNWVMQGVITVAALIIIIVLRNEISSVLLSNDLKSFFWGIPQYQVKTPVNLIVDSVHELAETKMGALIILPLKQGISSVIQSGISIDAKLSQEMLTSLFWDKNPLHDGAAVIQGDRIINAGAILPLSKREDLPTSFGTRHRAAQGLSELTDAVIIVVSEERGRITVFNEEQTHNIINRDDLENLLDDYVGTPSSKKGLNHPAVEFATVLTICLLCMTGLWVSFSKGMETFATFEVPVEFINPDQKMEIISSSASTVKLQISGSRPLINTMGPEQINVTLDLRRSEIGMNRLFVSQDNIILPPGIHLKTIDPQVLEINLDTLVEKELSVQPHWVGKLPKGFIMTATRANPPSIKVTGGGLSLMGTFTLFTEPIKLDQLTKPGKVTVPIASLPDSFKLAYNDPVEIHFDISSK